jgi:hypothetical protein
LLFYRLEKGTILTAPKGLGYETLAKLSRCSPETGDRGTIEFDHTAL